MQSAAMSAYGQKRTLLLPYEWAARGHFGNTPAPLSERRDLCLIERVVPHGKTEQARWPRHADIVEPEPGLHRVPFGVSAALFPQQPRFQRFQVVRGHCHVNWTGFRRPP